MWSCISILHCCSFLSHNVRTVEHHSLPHQVDLNINFVSRFHREIVRFVGAHIFFFCTINLSCEKQLPLDAKALWYAIANDFLSEFTDGNKELNKNTWHFWFSLFAQNSTIPILCKIYRIFIGFQFVVFFPPNEGSVLFFSPTPRTRVETWRSCKQY